MCACTLLVLSPFSQYHRVIPYSLLLNSATLLTANSQNPAASKVNPLKKCNQLNEHLR
jgi:hypothetical protein